MIAKSSKERVLFMLFAKRIQNIKEDKVKLNEVKRNRVLKLFPFNFLNKII